MRKSWASVDYGQVYPANPVHCCPYRLAAAGRLRCGTAYRHPDQYPDALPGTGYRNPGADRPAHANTRAHRYAYAHPGTHRHGNSYAAPPADPHANTDAGADGDGDADTATDRYAHAGADSRSYAHAIAADFHAAANPYPHAAAGADADPNSGVRAG